MNDGRAMRIAVAFAAQAANSPTGRLCGACVEVLGVSGVTITIMSGHHTGPGCASSACAAAPEELQLSLGP